MLRPHEGKVSQGRMVKRTSRAGAANPRQKGKNMKLIVVTFIDGMRATYTDGILNLLLTDETVLEIMDKETGEIIFKKS